MQHLPLWSDRLEISDHRFRIAFVHAKRHHGQAQGLAVSPNAGGEQFDHVGIACGKRAADSRCIERPVRIVVGGLPNYRRSLQEPAAVQRAIGVSRSMALHAHRDTFHQVLAVRNFGNRRTGIRLLRPRGTA